MEQVNIDPDHVVTLIKRLIEIHRKWIIEGIDDAADKKNEEAGLTEQHAIIAEFAARRGMPDDVRSGLTAVICRFLVGGLTGGDDGPLVDNVADDVFHAFAVRLSDAIAMGRDLRKVFPYLEATKADLKPSIADELYTAMERLGADDELLGIVGSWRDTITDEEVLALLREYNWIGEPQRPQ